MMLPTRNQTHSAQAITLFSLKLLLAPADYAAKAGCTALSHSLNFPRTPYRLYLRGTGGRAGISGHFDSARSLHSADHARAVDSRQSANHLWSRHGWRLNADIIRLCLRKYWYGKRYSAGCRGSAPTGQLWRIGANCADGWVRDCNVNPHPQENVVEKRVRGAQCVSSGSGSASRQECSRHVQAMMVSNRR